MSAAVERVEVPATALLADALPRVDYSDAYRLTLEADDRRSIRELTRSLFEASAPWMQRLLGLRDAIVGPLGLKTRQALRGKDALGPGVVLAEREDELLLGANDRHLDFRVSVLRTVTDAAPMLTVTTLVQFHNRLGRFYFLPVGPVHRKLVPSLLRRLDRGGSTP